MTNLPCEGASCGRTDGTHSVECLAENAVLFERREAVKALASLANSIEANMNPGAYVCPGFDAHSAVGIIRAALSVQPQAEPAEDFLTEVYEQCCNSIKPYVDKGLLPASVVESLDVLIKRFSAPQAERLPLSEAAWQPIATAPKETEILLTAEFDRPGDWRIKTGYFYEEAQSWRVFGASWKPTHWMPLPPPPGALKEPT